MEDTKDELDLLSREIRKIIIDNEKFLAHIMDDEVDVAEEDENDEDLSSRFEEL